MGVKGGLMDVVELHSDLMISGLKIQLSEECRTMEFVKQFIDGWDWVSVLGSDAIERSIVHTKAPRTILFLTKSTNDEKGLKLGRIIPVASISLTARSISFFWMWGY